MKVKWFKRKQKLTIPSKYILLGLSVVCAIFVGMSAIAGKTSGPLRNAASVVLVPMQKGINEIGHWFSDRHDDLQELRNVMAENEALKAQVDELTTENSVLLQDKYELERLRELYELDKKYSEYEKVGARVIGKEPGNWYHTFVIDKGTDDGIKVDMNVIAGRGLVGRVIDVDSDSATVLSIIDDSSNVSGSVLNTSDNCVVTGDLQLMNENKISFSKLNDEKDQVKSGDKIITSNISDKYLPGILIGYVDAIAYDSNNLTKSGTVIPAVDFMHLDEVLVILELK